MTAEVWITGIGLVSSLGEGAGPHLAALADPGFQPVLDRETFAPFTIHPLPALPFETQMPRRDLRQMETWQRLGVFTAGLALDSAAAKPLAADIDLVVAAGGGERDVALDATIFAEIGAVPAAERPAWLNQRIAGGLRPTLFLAQLPNLLAGSITIVHGVARSSRTLMGMELAGADALRLGLSRVAHGASAMTLVGASLNPARWDELMTYGSAGLNLTGDWQPVAQRAAPGGFCLGGLGCFLLLEAADHARARGAAPFARLAHVGTGMAQRQGEDTAAASAATLLAPLRGRLRPGAAVLSAATGAAATAEEAAFLASTGAGPARFTADMLGHGVEASFPAAIALAALQAQAGLAPQTLVSGFGAWRGEALALVEAV